MNILCVAGQISPKKSVRTKYCPKAKRGFNSSTFNNYRLPTSIVTALVSASNQSLALNTWSSYNMLESHLKRYQADTGVSIRFPMDDRDMMYILFGPSNSNSLN